MERGRVVIKGVRKGGREGGRARERGRGRKYYAVSDEYFRLQLIICDVESQPCVYKCVVY